MEILNLFLILFNGLVLIIGFFYGIYHWYNAAKIMFAITNFYKHDINPWSWKTGFSPTTGLIFMNMLTVDGKEKAIIFWESIFKFILAVLIPFAVAYLTEIFTGIEIINR